MMNFIRVTYLIRAADYLKAKQRAAELALEQTLEIPEAAIPRPEIRAGYAGRVMDIQPLSADPGSFRVGMAYPWSSIGHSWVQFFNVLLGNSSMQRDVFLEDVEHPQDWPEELAAPGLGVEALRRHLGVSHRPLAVAALKPMGLEASELAERAYLLAVSGIDIIKDDHGLADQKLAPFKERVGLCWEAIQKAADKTGKLALYLPNLTAAPGLMHKHAAWACRMGIQGFLVAPMLSGPGAFHELASAYPAFYMAHPAFSGAFFNHAHFGIAPQLLLGKIFRYLGATLSVFPSFVGRFAFAPETCRQISNALRCPMSSIPTAMPAPAGGMSLEGLPDLIDFYGSETAFVLGGALLAPTDQIDQNARTFTRLLGGDKSAGQQPKQTFHSACEWQGAATAAVERLDMLTQRQPFRWQGRVSEAYKEHQELPFKGIERQELIGQNGEQTAFDLRYFEIAPGGYSSWEKHQHEHVVIGARGQGQVVLGEDQRVLHPNDIVYIRPWQPHQFRNSSSQAFGFYCIVDHKRDRPRSVDGYASENTHSTLDGKAKGG